MSGRTIRSVSNVDDQGMDRLEEAGHWFDQLEEGIADRNAFEKWRADPENAIAFDKVVDSANWLDNQKFRIPDNYIDRQMIQAKGRRRFILTAISGVGVALVGGGVFAFLNPPRAEASTGVGDRISIALPDGGRLDLNTDSKVFWRFDKKQRRIWLERGEAAVAVAPDARPLLLMRGAQHVTIANGAINVRAIGDNLAVTVMKGDCVVADINHANVPLMRVTAGSEATLGSAAPTVKVLTPDQIESTSAWQSNEIVFGGMELGQAIGEYNRYLKRKIVLTDSSLGTVRIGGRFTTRDPAEFLAALRTSFSLTVKDEGKGPILVSK